MKTNPGAKARHAEFIAERRAATPPGPRLMDLPAANWVLDNVLIHQQDFPRVPCACYLGICGHCAAGRHHECRTNVLDPGPIEGPEGWVLRRAGTVIFGATVWLSDRTCAWRCPCRTCRAAARAPRREKAEQLDLFSVAS